MKMIKIIKFGIKFNNYKFEFKKSIFFCVKMETEKDEQLTETPIEYNGRLKMLVGDKMTDGWYKGTMI